MTSTLVLTFKAIILAKIVSFIERLTEDPKERAQMLELWNNSPPKSKRLKPPKPFVQRAPNYDVEIVIFRNREGDRVDPRTSLVFDNEGRVVAKNVKGKRMALQSEDVEYCLKSLIPCLKQRV